MVASLLTLGLLLGCLNLISSCFPAAAGAVESFLSAPSTSCLAPCLLLSAVSRILCSLHQEVFLVLLVPVHMPSLVATDSKNPLFTVALGPRTVLSRSSLVLLDQLLQPGFYPRQPVPLILFFCQCFCQGITISKYDEGFVQDVLVPG